MSLETKVFPPEMQIAHLDDGSKAQAPPLGNSKAVHWRLIDHPVHPQAGLPKVAELETVSWLDVTAVFQNQQAGKYKVRWRINLNGARPDPVLVGTEFRAVTFNKDEDSSQERAPAALLKAGSVQEFMQHTDRPNTVPGQPKNLEEARVLEEMPGYDANVQGFFTLTLPGDVQVEQGGGVVTQIRNHEGNLKSGFQIEYAQLVRSD
ncbi:hypothetical protein BGX27_001729 [Mortierella sp. AM989]|nr:hypothetical protein BGX27_001729 [Mortierella sp. AM989]